jgi:hypothetical protein
VTALTRTAIVVWGLAVTPAGAIGSLGALLRAGSSSVVRAFETELPLVLGDPGG